MRQKFDIIIIGGGIHGLATAYWLAKTRQVRIALIEQFTMGHPFGSSQGTSRTLRSVYPNPQLTSLMQEVARDFWPAWEKEMGVPMFYPNLGCLFGEGARFGQYLQAAALSCDFDILSPLEARRLFPDFRFETAEAVIHDKTAGTLAASVILEHLKRCCLSLKVSIFEQTKVTALNLGSLLTVETEQGLLGAEKILLTAGSWISELLPTLKPLFSVIRQTVCYLTVNGSAPSSWPNWSFIGKDRVFYGLPEFGRPGIKVAEHQTSPSFSEDPDVSIQESQSHQIASVLEFAEREFTHLPSLLSTETCLYTMTRNEDFIIDYYPPDARLLIGSACSGHGFKWAPLIGKALGQLALTDTTWPSFESIRKSNFSF